MTPSISAFLVIVLSFLAILVTVGLVMSLIRLNNIEQHLERTALLLTVLANKQGATEEDIRKATSA